MKRETGITIGIEVGINFIICGLLNGLIAWALYRRGDVVPVDFWSIFIDTTITCFLVSLITAFFATAAAKRYRGKELYIRTANIWKKRLDALPEAALPMGSCLFGICLPVWIAVFGIVFCAAGTENISVTGFALFKGIWGGAYGAAVCAVILIKHLIKDSKNHD